MTDSTYPLGDTAFLAAFLDTVIPPDAERRMPGAGSLGIESAFAAVITNDARSGAAISDGLAAIRGAGDFASLSPSERVSRIEAQAAAQPGLMPALLRHLYQLYYQDIRVLLAVGEPGRPPFPEGFEVGPMDADLLEIIESRGRLTPRR